MNYPTLSSGILLRRYKRFLADIMLKNGQQITAHCANTGAMTGLAQPGARVWVSYHDTPKRKLAWSWELVEVDTPVGTALASVNTSRTNALVHEALNSGLIINEIASITPEVKVDDTRLDFKLSDHSGQVIWMEVKQVTLLDQDGIGAFPDAVSLRALRHVEALMTCVAQGERAILLFCATHGGIHAVRPAAEIHPAYASMLKTAQASGVEIMAYGCHLDPRSMVLTRALPVLL